MPAESVNRHHGPQYQFTTREKELKRIETALKTGQTTDVLAKKGSQTSSLTAMILAEAGVDLEEVAKVVKRGLNAKRKIVVEKTLMNKDGTPRTNNQGSALNVKKTITVDNHEVQMKTALTILTLLSPPEQAKQASNLTIIASTTPQVPDWMLGLPPELKSKAFMERVRAIANGLPPPPPEAYIGSGDTCPNGIIENEVVENDTSGD